MSRRDGKLSGVLAGTETMHVIFFVCANLYHYNSPSLTAKQMSEASPLVSIKKALQQVRVSAYRTIILMI